MNELQKKLSLKFNDDSLLQRALTHPSLGKTRPNYERLEFLGDSVLGLIISSELFQRHPNEAEGELTKRLAGLICGETLVKVAQNLHLAEHILMSDSEKNSGGRENKANLENVMEAIIGALYLDQGFEAAQSFVLQNWGELMDKMLEPPKDAKSALQEWAQGRGLPLPEYTVTRQEGPSHAPEFEISVTVYGFPTQIGYGNSKRIAEQEAATKLFESLRVAH
jgi:ribonuclease-3